MLNIDTLNLINLLNIDPVFSYEVVETNNEYQLITRWYEEGYGEYERVIFTTRDHSELNGLLRKELDRLCK